MIHLISIISRCCFWIICLTITNVKIFAQCSIPWLTECIDEVSICALQDINGINCRALDYSNAPDCQTLCGAPVNNVIYLPFQSAGGQLNVQINVSNCVNNNGLEMAITSGCSCQPIACQTSCNGTGVYSMTATVPSCRYLYLVIDGCGADVCDFVLTCSGPGSRGPFVPGIQDLLGNTQVCQGACKVKYSVLSDNKCTSTLKRTWTLNNQVVGPYNSSELTLDFPESGIFELCIEIQGKFRTCEATEKKCKTITVVRNSDRFGASRILCPERKPFLWHSQLIHDNGIFRSEFTTPTGCCKYDSVVEFIYLDEPEVPTVYHLACHPSDSFVDPTSKRIINTCQNMLAIFLRKSTQLYRCDSSYFLNAAFLDYKMEFPTLCHDSLILSAQLRDESDSCILPWLDTDIAFRWYLGSDSLKKTIGTDSFLRITRSDHYCLEMTARSMFGMREYDCSYDFCQKIDLSSYTPDPVCPIGLTGGNPSFDHYTIDVSELPADARRQHWRAVGGNIVSPMDSSSISILWDPATVEGIICYRYENSCFPSEECCITVKLISSGSEVRHSKDLRLVPNPFREGFSVWVDPAVHVRGMYLADQLGRRIWSSKPDHTPLSFPMFVTNEILNPGVYYFCAETNKGLLVQRLMKF